MPLNLTIQRRLKNFVGNVENVPFHKNLSNNKLKKPLSPVVKIQDRVVKLKQEYCMWVPIIGCCCLIFSEYLKLKKRHNCIKI